MRSSEDNADDEFVFVANKLVAARCYNNAMSGLMSSSTSSSSSSSPFATNTTTRSPRPHPRLNHLQPIPTTLDLMPSPVARTLTNASNTTTSLAKATPLPPELIELLPPHMRINTVPDYSLSSSSPFYPDSSKPSSGKDDVPERPPLPTAYCPGDYSNLEETTPTSSAPHNYAYLSDLITSDALSVLTATHTPHVLGTRASSLTSSRPSSRSSSTSNTHTASHTAPAALGLTDSGISSGGSSSSSSGYSSRSNSSRSLPREGSRTSLNGRPLQPPSPKFARNPVASTATSASPSNGYSVSATTTTSSAPPPSPHLTKVSYTAVLASDGERASMYRKLEALTPTPSPLLNNFRANSNPQATTRTELSAATVEGRPHTRHVATAHTTLTAMGQCKSSSTSHTSTPSQTPSSTPTPNQTPNHTPTSGRKSKALLNGVSSTAGVNKGKDGGRGVGGEVGYVSSSSSPSSPVLTSRRLPSSRASPIRNTPTLSSTSTHLSSAVHSSSSMGQVLDRPARGFGASSPPSSPELRRAWNVVGVPVSLRGSPATSNGPSPASSPTPRPGYPIVSSSDPDCIYDNLVVRHPPLAAPTPKSTPMASVPPTFTPISHPLPTAQHYQGPSSTPPFRRVIQSPIASPKPQSPPSQRRASRSPTPTRGWVAAPSGPVNPQYVPYYPPQDGPCSGCWVPVWGSSPQLYQGGGTAMYPAYVYGGPPSGPPSGPPGGVMCEGRSHSCDRMQAPRPSPPSSPRNGRRSASPWRGGSASPVSHRHSPSPDPGSGRPPRPRRPPMRKSKTVEVGFLGVGAHQQPPAPPSSSMGEGMAMSDSSYPITYLQGPPSQSPSSNQMYGHQVGHHVPVSYQKYMNQKQQQRVPNFDIIHEQIRNSGDEYHPFGGSPTSSSSYTSFVNGTHDLTSPSLVTSTCYASSPENVNSSLSSKHGQAEITKPKVTYKSSFYKCMKNLLRPIQ